MDAHAASVYITEIAGAASEGVEMEPRHRKNLNVLLPCFVVLGIMFGLVAYAPQLYRAFCGATGYGGTTQRAYSDPTATSDKSVTVAFDSNVAPNLPWRFEPEQRSVTVHLGEQKLVFFTAENLSNESIVGHATFNVTPETSVLYFNKIQCFCFNEERLDPHQKVDMPVVFFVDPAFAKDSDNLHVDTITLSYTFLRSVNPRDGPQQDRTHAQRGRRSQGRLGSRIPLFAGTNEGRCHLVSG
jgi:cytochrome c oxidase assembly protein Cox11